jgi:hypothetical protein
MGFGADDSFCPIDISAAWATNPSRAKRSMSDEWVVDALSRDFVYFLRRKKMTPPMMMMKPRPPIGRGADAIGLEIALGGSGTNRTTKTIRRLIRSSSCDCPTMVIPSLKNSTKSQSGCCCYSTKPTRSHRRHFCRYGSKCRQRSAETTLAEE